MALTSLRRTARAARILNFEQRVAAAGALLLIVSTFGSFSFVEGGRAARSRSACWRCCSPAREGTRFHLPFGDGTVIAGAGVWAGALIVRRLFDRASARTCFGARRARRSCSSPGTRERAKRPADDVPAEAPGGTPPIRTRRPPRRPGAAARGGRHDGAAPAARVQALRAAEGEQLHLGPEDREDAQA